MIKHYHILNGDCLKDQFPENISGEIIVARECLVDGDIKGKNLDEFYANRARFLNENYGVTLQDYYNKSLAEFKKIEGMAKDTAVYLWFEDDLFCQVNFWFVTSLIRKNRSNSEIYLIRPEKHDQYGFGGLDKAELIDRYKKRLLLTAPDQIASLWEHYQNDDLDKLHKKAQELESVYPFILPAVKAHIDRIPSKESKGRPDETLRAIVRDLKTEEFGPVFKEFSRREPIYGYGDVQVKRLLDRILGHDSK